MFASLPKPTLFTRVRLATLPGWSTAKVIATPPPSELPITCTGAVMPAASTSPAIARPNATRPGRALPLRL